MGRHQLYLFVSAAAIVVPAIWFWSNRGSPRDSDHQALSQVTSGWCSGKDNIDRLCRFKNLCYSNVYDSFIFFHGEESILEGIPRNRFEPALVDLSSVADHNTQYFHYTDVEAGSKESVPHRDYRYKRGKYLLFNRFNPSNMMHVFHDDLLPIFFTILHHGLMEDGKPSVTLLPFEGWFEGDFLNLYRIFSREIPLLKRELPRESLTCFEETYVGLSKLSTWYQYGFQVPQGPLADLNVTSFHIKYFRDFFRRNLNLSHSCPGNFSHGILLSREENRLILNEAELAVTISNVFNLKMLTLSMESQNIGQIIRAISCSKLLVGVHGSLLILSMFLPPSSILLEVFPFGINPDHYTPYKTLVSLPGMGIEYVSWRNVKVENTVTHPEYDPQYGGILHLDEADQELILESSEVPPHLCCRDTQWLFRIYQDTIVDIPPIIEMLTKTMIATSIASTVKDFPRTGDYSRRHLAPGFVSGFHCVRVDNSLYHLSWQVPWNVELINEEGELQYEIWVQVHGSSDIDKYVAEGPLLVVIDASDGYQNSFVWVRPFISETRGPWSFIECP